jgi:anti-anti-sigma factor
LVINLGGEIDFSESGRLRRRLLTLIDLAAGKGSDIEIDLSDVSFIDCSGIAALVAAWLRAQADGCQLTVNEPASGPVASLLSRLRPTLPFQVTFHDRPWPSRRRPLLGRRHAVAITEQRHVAVHVPYPRRRSAPGAPG